MIGRQKCAAEQCELQWWCTGNTLFLNSFGTQCWHDHWIRWIFQRLPTSFFVISNRLPRSWRFTATFHQQARSPNHRLLAGNAAGTRGHGGVLCSIHRSLCPGGRLAYETQEVSNRSRRWRRFIFHLLLLFLLLGFWWHLHSAERPGVWICPAFWIRIEIDAVICTRRITAENIAASWSQFGRILNNPRIIQPSRSYLTIFFVHDWLHALRTHPRVCIWRSLLVPILDLAIRLLLFGFLFVLLNLRCNVWIQRLHIIRPRLSSFTKRGG
mmetsp:Transcript_74091/g.140992  ORF Transcript_74091/g.140992 Transcript_74091/m.140992 type:complete len:269 (+) Transcript_74091:3-809(+)